MFRGYLKVKAGVFGALLLLALFVLANVVILKAGEGGSYHNLDGPGPYGRPPPKHKLPFLSPPRDPVAIASEYSNKIKLVVFPKRFAVPSKDLDRFYSEHFGEIEVEYNLIKFNDGSELRSDALLTQNMEDKQFSPYSIRLFDTFRDSKSNKELCSITEQAVDVEVTEPSAMDTTIESVVQSIYESKSQYVDELRQYFEEDYAQQVAENSINKHWWKFASTSVWLEQYGVHFMISRVIYSPSGLRGSPIVSLTYAQVFNDQWKELKNVELIVPTNCPDKFSDRLRVGDLYYKKMRYPAVIEVPFFHDPEKRASRFYGPEDPRLLLVKNAAGYEEPLMVYNLFHRKIVDTHEVSEEELSTNVGFYRSMWICWPWQYQRGKRNVDDLALAYDGALYNRAAELRGDGVKRKDKQKNWTPFIDYEERLDNFYDKHIYFIYRWTHLEVFKCTLADIVDGRSSCVFAYRMDKESNENMDVGEFRGGTELVSVNQLVEETSVEVSEFLMSFLEYRQVWVGFARAHIRDCGCGGHMYRPNFVVVTREREYEFKIDKVSSFLSLNVPMISWVPGSNDLCKHQSVFIPNGVSSWSFDQDGLDHLTLSYTLSDTTNDIVHVRGLLGAIASHDRRSIAGFNDYNIDCAIDASRDFCKEFGEAHKGH